MENELGAVVWQGSPLVEVVVFLLGVVVGSGLTFGVMLMPMRSYQRSNRLLVDVNDRLQAVCMAYEARFLQQRRHEGYPRPVRGPSDGDPAA